MPRLVRAIAVGEGSFSACRASDFVRIIRIGFICFMSAMPFRPFEPKPRVAAVVFLRIGTSANNSQMGR